MGITTLNGGIDAIKPKMGETKYSAELKRHAIINIIDDGLSQYETAVKFNISLLALLGAWRKNYNQYGFKLDLII